MFNRFRIYVVLLFAVSTTLFAQKNDAVEKPIWKRDTLIGNGIFGLYNNWVSGGFGNAKNTAIDNPQFYLNVDFSFHITKHYFQVGALPAGNGFRNYNDYRLHAGYGLRKENTKFHLACFTGLSTSLYYKFNNNTFAHNLSNEMGGYIAAQAVRKVSYDVGAGVQMFADVNRKQSLFGGGFILYFSSAYKGKKK